MMEVLVKSTTYHKCKLTEEQEKAVVGYSFRHNVKISEAIIILQKNNPKFGLYENSTDYKHEEDSIVCIFSGEEWNF